MRRFDCEGRVHLALNTNERTLTVIVRHACSHLAYVSVETPTEAVAKIVELADKGLVLKAIARVIEGEWPSVTRAQACVSRGSCFRLTRTDPFPLVQRNSSPVATRPRPARLCAQISRRAELRDVRDRRRRSRGRDRACLGLYGGRRPTR
jgi:hypothetical protein